MDQIFAVEPAKDIVDVAEADELATTGLSVVTILSSDYGRRDGESLSAYRARTRDLPNHTSTGLRIAVCPATYLDVSCVECQVCSRPRPNGTVMGFPAHANKVTHVDAIFMEKRGGTPPQFGRLADPRSRKTKHWPECPLRSGRRANQAHLAEADGLRDAIVIQATRAGVPVYFSTAD